MREGEKEEQTQTNYKLVIIPNKVLTSASVVCWKCAFADHFKISSNYVVGCRIYAEQGVMLIEFCSKGLLFLHHLSGASSLGVSVCCCINSRILLTFFFSCSCVSLYIFNSFPLIFEWSEEAAYLCSIYVYKRKTHFSR